MLASKRIRSFRPGTAAKLPDASRVVFARRPRPRSDCFNGLSDIGLISAHRDDWYHHGENLAGSS